MPLGPLEIDLSLDSAVLDMECSEESFGPLEIDLLVDSVVLNIDLVHRLVVLLDLNLLIILSLFGNMVSDFVVLALLDLDAFLGGALFSFSWTSFSPFIGKLRFFPLLSTCFDFLFAVLFFALTLHFLLGCSSSTLFHWATWFAYLHRPPSMPMHVSHKHERFRTFMTPSLCTLLTLWIILVSGTPGLVSEFLEISVSGTSMTCLL